MTYRYRMHWFADPKAPVGPWGRPLFGRNHDEAIAHAEQLWKEGAYPQALGYRVVDTDDGAVLWQRRRSSQGG
jgi:hypothetical protein